jgi:L-aspartate oxidase
MGLDISKEWIPVVPTQHYLCGGIEVSDSGKTSIEGLYAIGECANTGLHGANRLASNSLLEAVYFAKKAANEIFNRKAIKSEAFELAHEFKNFPIKKLSREALQQKMSENAAIIKRTENMQDMVEWINTQLRDSQTLDAFTLADIETNHMYYVSLWLLKDALDQKQNIGVHYNENL